MVVLRHGKEMKLPLHQVTWLLHLGTSQQEWQPLLPPAHDLPGGATVILLAQPKHSHCRQPEILIYFKADISLLLPHAFAALTTVNECCFFNVTYMSIECSSAQELRSIDLLWSWCLLRLDTNIVNKLLNLVHTAVEWRLPLQITIMLTSRYSQMGDQVWRSQGDFGIFKYVLFIYSLQDPKGTSVPLHTRKVPR